MSDSTPTPNDAPEAANPSQPSEGASNAPEQAPPATGSPQNQQNTETPSAEAPSPPSQDTPQPPSDGEPVVKMELDTDPSNGQASAEEMSPEEAAKALATEELSPEQAARELGTQEMSPEYAARELATMSTQVPPAQSVPETPSEKAIRTRRRAAGTEPQGLSKAAIGLIAGLGATCLVLAGLLFFTLSSQSSQTAQTTVEKKEKRSKKPKRSADEPAKAPKWLVQYDAFVKAHPKRLKDRDEQLRKLERKHNGERKWASDLQSRRAELDEALKQANDALIEKLGQAALKKAESGDFRGAFADLARMPGKDKDISMRTVYYRHQIESQAKKRMPLLDRRAQEQMKKGNFNGALAAYDELAPVKLGEIRVLLKTRQAEIRDAQKIGLDPSAGQRPKLEQCKAFYLADVYVGQEGVTNLFDKLCEKALHGSDWTIGLEADAKLETYPRSAMLYYIRAVSGVRFKDKADARHAIMEARRLALSSKPFASRLLSLEARLIGLEANTAGVVPKARQALALDPNNADAHFILGMHQFLQSQGLKKDDPRLQTFLQRGKAGLKRAAELDSGYARYEARIAQRPELGQAVKPDKYAYVGRESNPYEESIVVVSGETKTARALGTGFVVKADGNTAWVITNEHVIEGLKKLTVRYCPPGGRTGEMALVTTRRVTLVAKDKKHDLALLKAECDRKLPVLGLRKTVTGLTVPMPVQMVGHPSSSAGITLEFTVVRGELSSHSRIFEGVRHLQISSHADHGMSGGPVIDKQGRVIGVLRGMYVDIANQNIAILSEHVRDICTQGGIEVPLLSANETITVAKAPSPAAPQPAPQPEKTEAGKPNAEKSDAGLVLLREKIDEFIRSFDFQGALTELKTARAGAKAAGFKEGLVREKALVERAHRAFGALLDRLKKKPINASEVQKGTDGEYAKPTQEAVTLRIKDAKTRQSMDMTITWEKMPRPHLARLALVAARPLDAEAQLDFMSWCMFLGQKQEAAEILRWALLKSPALKAGVAAMGSRTQPILTQTQVLTMEKELGEIRALLARGRAAEAKSSMAAFSKKYGDCAAHPKLAAKVRMLSGRLGLGGAATNSSKPVADKGAGAAAANTVQIACPVCKGSGVIETMGCRRCRRLGRIVLAGKVQDCKECEGEGSVAVRCPGCGSVPTTTGKPCAICAGTGKPKCGFCSGKGHLNVPDHKIPLKHAVLCPSCAGNRFDRQVKCSRCSGREKVILEERYRPGLIKVHEYPCPMCDSKGKAEPTCGACNGTGVRSVMGRNRMCQNCQGTGKVFRQCRTCMGLGHIRP